MFVISPFGCILYCKALHFISSPLYLLMLLFHVRAQMFHFLCIVLNSRSIFTLSSIIIARLSFMVCLMRQICKYIIRYKFVIILIMHYLGTFINHVDITIL